jgi:hypothetical protein
MRIDENAPRMINNCVRVIAEISSFCLCDIDDGYKEFHKPSWVNYTYNKEDNIMVPLFIIHL